MSESEAAYVRAFSKSTQLKRKRRYFCAGITETIAVPRVFVPFSAIVFPMRCPDTCAMQHYMVNRKEKEKRLRHAPAHNANDIHMAVFRISRVYERTHIRKTFKCICLIANLQRSKYRPFYKMLTSFAALAACSILACRRPINTH